MYSTRRIGNEFYVVDPNGVISMWHSYSKRQADQLARALDNARATYFESEEPKARS